MNHSNTDVRSENILSVLEALAREQYMTREALAQRCRLSLTTVGKIIDRLHDYGILSQKHIRSVQSGRAIAAFSFSDSTVNVIFRISEQEMAMELTDLRLRRLQHIVQDVTPDRDPGENLMSFLLLCRKNLEMTHKSILLCGLIAESNALGCDMIVRAIETHLNLSVAVRDRTVDAIARAASYEGLTADGRCVAVLSNDASCGGIILCGETMIRSGNSSLERQSDDLTRSADELLQTMQMLTTFFTPDVLLICSTRDTTRLKEDMETAIKASSLPYHPTVEIRDTNQFIALGVTISMRTEWLKRMHRDNQQLRSRIFPSYSSFDL